MKKTLSISRNIILVTLLVVGVSYVQAAFQQPLGTPQTTNVDAPVNTGGVAQVKTGGLGASILTSASRIGAGVITGPVEMTIEGRSPSLWGRAAIGGSSPNNSSWFYLLAPSNGGSVTDIVRSEGTDLRFAKESSKGSGTFTTQATLTNGGNLNIAAGGKVNADDFCLNSNGTKCLGGTLSSNPSIETCSKVDDGTLACNTGLPASSYVCMLTTHATGGCDSSSRVDVFPDDGSALDFDAIAGNSSGSQNTWVIRLSGGDCSGGTMVGKAMCFARGSVITPP